MEAKNPHILIVEDVESNYLYLKAVLNKLKAEISWVKNGVEAVDFYKSHSKQIDLILMDLQMPEMNGYEATKLIKEINSEVIIIAQTAFAMSDDKSKALEAGCDDYLAKPIRSTDLLDTVKMHLKMD